MNLIRAARSGVLVTIGGLVLCSSFAVGVPLTACGDSPSCAKVRNDTYAAKRTWDACNPDDPEACIKVFGNPKDCTGVLSCDFAVNPNYRAEAEQAVLTIPGQSVGCYQCALPNCVSGDLALCERVSRRCILVSMVTEAGVTASSAPATRDAGTGAPLPGPPEASTSDAPSFDF